MAKTEQQAPPAGTGNMPGLGETFSINLSTGQGTFVYQLPIPDGINKFQPKLSLEYAHGFGHGPWGLGWRMNIRSISLRLDKGLPGDETTEQLLDNGNEIVPVDNAGGYMALNETAFTRYTRDNEGWTIRERNGLTHQLGGSPDYRLADPANPARVNEWLLRRSTDVSGNTIEYGYVIDNGMAYCKSVTYARYAVRFEYEARPDTRRDGRTGYLRSRNLRCSKMLLVLDPGAGEKTIRGWDFGYELSPAAGVSLLSTVRLTAFGAPDVQRPAVRFAYSSFDPGGLVVQWMKPASGSGPAPLTDPDVALVTLDNAPLPGILINRNGRAWYYSNDGKGNWGPGAPVPHTPMVSSFASEGLALIDMNGSGRADLMVANPGQLQGYYTNDGKDGWAGFVAFPRNRRSTPQWTSDRLRLMDVNGDGLVDALQSTERAFAWWQNEGESGWSSPQLIPKTSPDQAGIDLSSGSTYLADMTGDGLMDIVSVQSGKVEFWQNLGKGKFAPGQVLLNSPRISRRVMDNDELLLADIDGDGCADLIHFSSQGLTIYQNRNGVSFGDGVTIAGVPRPLSGTVRAVNMTGRAGVGLLWNSIAARGIGYVSLQFDTTQPSPYLLTEMQNGTGLVSQIMYRSAIEDYLADKQLGKIWTTNFPFPYMVVGGTKETDLVTGKVTEVSFKYHEAHFESRSRQFQGFRRTERLEKGDDSRPDTLLLHTFLMAQEWVSGPEYAALNGMLSKVETFLMDGGVSQELPYRTETSEYQLTVLGQLADGRKRVFVAVSSYREEDTERTADSRVELKTYTYDGNGNVLTEVHQGQGVAGGVAQVQRQYTTTMKYAVGGAAGPIDRQSVVAITDNNGVLLSEKRFYYDGDAYTGLALGQIDKGRLVRTEEMVMLAPDFEAHYQGMDWAALGYIQGTTSLGTPAYYAVTKNLRLNDQGIMVGEKDALGAETVYAYDVSGLFKMKLTNALGDTVFEYDPAVGQVTTVTYSNGSKATFTYDAQGRMLSSTADAANADNPPAAYTYDETVIPTRRTVTFQQAGGVTSKGITYFDGYGNEFQQRVEVQPGQFLVSGLKLPNAWGNLRVEYEPTFSNSADFALPPTAGAPFRSFFYDAKGRIIRSVNYDGGVSTALYTPFRVVTRDANDNDDSAENKARGQFDTPHEEVFDVFRFLTAVNEYSGSTLLSGASYQVGLSGELLGVGDGNGVKSSYTNDRMNNRLVIHFREAGTRKIWYNANKKPVRTLDAVGNDIRAEWDTLGRLLALKSGDQTLETYVYDSAGQHALGKIAEVTYEGGKQVFTYNLKGQLTKQSWLFDGDAAEQSIQMDYDTMGRETSLVYPDGTSVVRELYFNGWVRKINGIIDDIQYNERGFITGMQYTNGAKTSRTWLPGPGKISTQEILAKDGTVLENSRFSYDRMGILLGSEDTAPNGKGSKKYSYDALYQLTGANQTENGNPVQRNYAYSGYNLSLSDEAGVRLFYDSAGMPDRAAGIQVGAAARFDLVYDANGNTLQLPDQQFVYNAKNELVHFSGKDGVTADYSYDFLGHRVQKRLNSGQTIRYIGQYAETSNAGMTCFVMLGSMRVALFSGGTTYGVHENALGSTSFITDAAGALFGKIDFHPYGNVLSESGHVDFPCYALHRLDAESGLIYMHRRYYSPAMGRFLTPDLMAIYQPEQFLHHPVGLHPYAYVANDPLNKVDPTGLSFWSFLGSVVGVIVGVIVGILIVAATVMTGGIAGILIGIGLTLAAGLVMTGVSYIVASAVDPNSAFGQFMRGFMIGFNAGMNAVLATAIFGPVIGVALGVINFLATFDGIAKNSVYQGILGWSSWLMPMSWGATGLGLVFYAFNLIVAGVTFQQVGAAKIEKLSIDWKTGAIVMVGGLIRNPTAFSMGNFVFMNPNYLDESNPDKTYQNVLNHETGHTLEVAAFGSVFVLADLIGENAVGRGAGDYGEEIAESHANRGGRPTIPMWG